MTTTQLNLRDYTKILVQRKTASTSAIRSEFGARGVVLVWCMRASLRFKVPIGYAAVVEDDRVLEEGSVVSLSFRSKAIRLFPKVFEVAFKTALSSHDNRKYTIRVTLQLNLIDPLVLKRLFDMLDAQKDETGHGVGDALSFRVYNACISWLADVVGNTESQYIDSLAGQMLPEQLRPLAPSLSELGLGVSTGYVSKVAPDRAGEGEEDEDGEGEGGSVGTLSPGFGLGEGISVIESACISLDAGSEALFQLFVGSDRRKGLAIGSRDKETGAIGPLTLSPTDIDGVSMELARHRRLARLCKRLIPNDAEIAVDAAFESDTSASDVWGGDSSVS